MVGAMPSNAYTETTVEPVTGTVSIPKHAFDEVIERLQRQQRVDRHYVSDPDAGDEVLNTDKYGRSRVWSYWGKEAAISLRALGVEPDNKDKP